MKEGVWCVLAADYESTYTVALFANKEEADKAAEWFDKEYGDFHLDIFVARRELETAEGFIERLANVPW